MTFLSGRRASPDNTASIFCELVSSINYALVSGRPHIQIDTPWSLIWEGLNKCLYLHCSSSSKRLPLGRIYSHTIGYIEMADISNNVFSPIRQWTCRLQTNKPADSGVYGQYGHADMRIPHCGSKLDEFCREYPTPHPSFPENMLQIWPWFSGGSRQANWSSKSPERTSCFAFQEKHCQARSSDETSLPCCM